MNRHSQTCGLALTTVILGLATATYAAVTGTWTNDANGNWSTGPWTGGTPGGAFGDTANLTKDITADRTVTLDTMVTLGTLVLQDQPSGSPWYSWTVAQGGANTITFDASGNGTGTAYLNVGKAGGNQGWAGPNNQVNVPISLNDNLTIQMYQWNSGQNLYLFLNGAIADGANGAKGVTIQHPGGYYTNNQDAVYLTTSNSFTGGLTLNYGQRVFVQAAGALGTGTVTFGATGGNNNLLVFDTQPSFTVNNNVSGLGGMFLTGARTLDLGGNNAGWTGSLSTQYQTGGIINLSSANAMSAATLALYGSNSTLNAGGSARSVAALTSNGSSSTLTIGAGGDVTFNAMSGGTTFGLNLIVNNTTTTINNIASGFNTLSKSGAGTLVLGGTNTYTGSISVGAGQVVLDSDTALGSNSANNLTVGGNTTVSTTATRTFANPLYTSYSSADRNVDLANGYNLTMGKFTVFNANGSLLALNATGPGILTLTSGVQQTANNAGLEKKGTGVLVLGAGSNYVLETRISAGVLRGTLPTAAGNDVVLNGGVYEAAGTFNLPLGNTGIREARWYNASAAGGFSAIGGQHTVDFNTPGTRDNLVWASTSGFVGATGTITLGSAYADNAVELYDHVDLNGAVREIKVNDNPSSANDKAVISGNLTGSGSSGLNKTGGGWLTLSGAKSYQGATTVAAGTLEVTGALASSGVTVQNGGTLLVTAVGFGAPISVQSGGTLGGTGSITTAVSLPSGATLAAGASPGVLTLTSSLTLSSGATVAVELGGREPGNGDGYYDQLLVTGTADVAGALLGVSGTGNFTNLAQPGDDFYILARGGGTGAFAGLAEGDWLYITGSPFYAQVTYLANWTGTQAGSSTTGGNDIALINLIPEPSALTLLALAGLALGARRRAQAAKRQAASVQGNGGNLV